MSKYYAGKGCTCEAKSEVDCCCGVDWTDPDIYRLRKDNHIQEKDIEDLNKRIRELELVCEGHKIYESSQLKRIDRLEKTLKFYAEKSYYRIQPIEDEPSEYWSTKIEEDCGFKARRALHDLPEDV